MEEKEDKYFLKQISLTGYKSIRETTIDIQSNLSIINKKAINANQGLERKEIR